MCRMVNDRINVLADAYMGVYEGLEHQLLSYRFVELLFFFFSLHLPSPFISIAEIMKNPVSS